MVSVKRKDLPEWLQNAIARVEAQQKIFICDTEEKAKEYGVPIGTTVVERIVQEVEADMQKALDNFRAREYIRSGLYIED